MCVCLCTYFYDFLKRSFVILEMTTFTFYLIKSKIELRNLQDTISIKPVINEDHFIFSLLKSNYKYISL